MPLMRTLCCFFSESSTVSVSPSLTPTTRPSTTQVAAKAGAAARNRIAATERFESDEFTEAETRRLSGVL